MKEITNYIKSYYIQTDRTVLLLISLFTAFLVFCNYYFRLDTFIRKNNLFTIKLLYWYIVFAAAFIVSYIIYGLAGKKNYLKNKNFYILLVVTPLIFAWKISASIAQSLLEPGSLLAGTCDCNFSLTLFFMEIVSQRSATLWPKNRKHSMETLSVDVTNYGSINHFGCNTR